MDLVDGLETSGRSSPNRIPAPHLRNVTSRTPQNFGVRMVLTGRRWIWGLSFSLDSLWLECPDANGPALLSGVGAPAKCVSLGPV